MDMNDLRRRNDALFGGCDQPPFPNFFELFPPRFRDPTVGIVGRGRCLQRPRFQPCDMDVVGRTTMDRILVDPELQTAWLDEDPHSRGPGLLRAGVPLSLEAATYFEIEIVASGDDGSIGIGLVPFDYPFGNQPGWKDGSIGYHADDGGIFIEQGSASKIKSKCQMGDRMGCGIEMVNGQQFVYFTKNGHSVAEQPFDGDGEDLFPAVGLNCPGAMVKLLDAHIWDLAPGNGLNPGLAMAGNDQPDDGADITINEQTGHISVFWKNHGYRDVMIPASVPFSRDKAYFEIELFAIGENDDVAIGFVPKDYPQKRLPGWMPNSVGFHVAKGQFFAGQPYTRKERLETFTIGDKIGCGIEHIGDSVQVYFNKNGVGFLEEEVTIRHEVYPVVGIRSAGKTVSVCVQDFETWGFEAKESIRHRPRPNTSAIKCDADNCTACLQSVPGETVIATLIANQPFSKDLSHFEFEFLGGESVVAGVVSQDYNVEELPGCHPKSLGYHSDDGGFYEECGRTSIFLETCSHGDSMGCSVDYGNKQTTFCFTKNGKSVFEVPFGSLHQKWFPAIGMRTEQTATSVLISDMNMTIWMDHPLHPLPHGVPHAMGGTRADGGHNDAPVDRLEEFGQELNCAICWNILERPKMFPCRQQHSYCFECLRNLFAGVALGGIVQCPVCRFEARAPNNVRDLPDNPILNRLIDAYKKLRR